MQAASDHLWHDSSIYHIYAMESLKLSDFLSISRSGQSLLSDPSHRFIFFSRLMELDEKDSSMSVHLRKLREALISSRDKTRFCIDIYAMSLWVALHQENLEELYKCACFLMSEFDEADYNKLIARPCPQIFQKFPSFYEKYKELSWSKLNHWFILIDLSLTLRTGKQLGISRDFSSKYLHGSFSIYFDLITSVNINNFTRFWRIFHNIGSNEQAIVKVCLIFHPLETYKRSSLEWLKSGETSGSLFQTRIINFRWIF